MVTAAQTSAEARVGWVDIAKGICIIFVVMMHSTLGTGLAMGGEGWMHQVVAFARPFRMPDFFLISGLFLGLVIGRPWLRFLDRKVVHFIYFYVLWLTIQFAFKAPGMAMEGGVGFALSAWLTAFAQPFGTLWFIYILPLFFLFTRLVKNLPVWFVLLWAAVLEMLPVHTGALVFDEFCARYVYFFAGYAFASRIFDIADWVRARPIVGIAYLGAWASINAALVFTAPPEALAVLLQPAADTGAVGGVAELPLVSLVLGFAGALAIVVAASLLSLTRRLGWLDWLGAHSIVIYLAFFLPMAVVRVLLIKTGVVTDIGSVSALVTAGGVIGPVVIYGLIQWSGFGKFLFERPKWASIEKRFSEPRLAAAE